MIAATARQMKEIDARAIASGLPSPLLMERAGQALSDYILREYSRLRPKLLLVLCGKGLNGGDGFVAARLLSEAGFSVLCVYSGGGNAECEEKHALYEKAGGKTAGALPPLADGSVGLIVDALFGTGLARPVSGWYAETIKAVNASGLPVVAADLPSGLSADRGELLGEAIHADATVAFTLPKPAHLLSPSYQYCGRLVVADIGIPRELIEACGPYVTVADRAFAKRALPARGVETHKYHYGRLVLLNGAVGYTGACRLALTAALSSGAGLVYAGVPDAIYPILAASCPPEAVVTPLPSAADGGFASDAAERAASLLSRADVIAAGSGVLPNDGARALLGAALASRAKLVLDAGMLSFLGITPGDRHINRVRPPGAPPPVLTPHDGELARLTGGPVLLEGEGRLEAAARISRELGAILVMKGHRTITASPDGRLWLNTTGNPGMARGGSGDLLSGLVASMLGQIADPAEAAALAVYLHGRAGDLAAERKGEHGVTAEAMLAALGDLFAELEQTP